MTSLALALVLVLFLVHPKSPPLLSLSSGSTAAPASCVRSPSTAHTRPPCEPLSEGYAYTPKAVFRPVVVCGACPATAARTTIVAVPADQNPRDFRRMRRTSDRAQRLLYVPALDLALVPGRSCSLDYSRGIDY